MANVFPMILSRLMARMVRLPVAIYRSARSRLICWFWGIEHGVNPFFAGPVFVRTLRRGEIRLGNRVRFLSKKSLNPLCASPTTLDARGGLIIVGDETGMSSVVLSSRSSITIGKRCLIGANTQIYDHNFHALKPDDRRDPHRRTNIKSSPVVIEDECFVGANCIILRGSCIGSGTIVSAGSVVFGLNVPPHSLVRGNPAVIVERDK